MTQSSLRNRSAHRYLTIPLFEDLWSVPILVYAQSGPDPVTITREYGVFGSHLLELDGSEVDWEPDLLHENTLTQYTVPVRFIPSDDGVNAHVELLCRYE